MSGSSTRRPKTCPCSWTKCLEYKNELTDASDIASGYFRVVSAKQQSSNSKLHNLRRYIEHHLHINQQTISNNKEYHVARHHRSDSSSTTDGEDKEWMVANNLLVQDNLAWSSSTIRRLQIVSGNNAKNNKNTDNNGGAARLRSGFDGMARLDGA